MTGFKGSTSGSRSLPNATVPTDLNVDVLPGCDRPLPRLGKYIKDSCLLLIPRVFDALHHNRTSATAPREAAEVRATARMEARPEWRHPERQ